MGASGLWLGIILAVRTATGALSAYNTRFFTRHISDKKLVVVVFIAIGASVVMTPFVTSVWMMLVPAVLSGFAGGLGFPPFKSLLLGGVQQEGVASIMSTNSVVNRFGQTVGPVLGGVLVATGGLDDVFWGGTILIVVMMIFYLYGSRTLVTRET